MAAGLAITLTNGVMVKLGKIAAEQALNEAPFLRNFKSDFQLFEKKLRHLCASLQAADEQNADNASVKKWLVEVRNIVFDVEDIIDECAVEHLYTNTSHSCVPNCSQLGFRYKIGNRIKGLKDRINSAIAKAEKLNLSHDVAHSSQPSTSRSGNEREAEWRRSSILYEDPPGVGIDQKVDEILRLLENPAIGVVAVIGMGGLGKTFLLQHFYNRNKQRYDHPAWISVSRTCSLRKLQCDLASQIGLEIDNTVRDVLVIAQSIHGKLDGKRCLIVLDDVWSSSVEGNLISRLGLPTGQCKIVVTTRSRDVVENINAHVYEMRQLSIPESRELFCMYAFPDRRPPVQLEGLSNQIVDECGRLPLAIKVVAASMNKSSRKSDWESKLGQLKYVGRAEDTIMKILKLSYDSLPSYLKSCFAYFSFFPEDTQIYFSRIESTRGIHQDYLIYLWRVEGFIPDKQGKDQWDIGLNYLHQLIDLCLVEVNTVSICYTVHDLLHDLVVSICKENGCKFDLPFTETSCRRLLLAKKGLNNNVISEGPLFCQRFLRTLSFSQNPGIASIPQHLFDRVRLLRVLDFSGTTISLLPESVGKLKLLRVLNLSNTKIREVPDCVRRFKHLEILDVSHCRSLQCVPGWIGELNYLSYLDVEWCSAQLRRSYMPKGMSQLLRLRTLKSDCFPLSIEENDFLNVKDVGNLISLQEISFTLNDARALTSVVDGALDGLVKMRILVVQNGIPDTGESRLPAFPNKMNVMKDLRELFLVRFSVPSWIYELEKLTLLSLVNCSNYQWLQRMSNLEILLLENDSKCRELPENFGERGGFRNLVSLQIRDFPRLVKLPALEEGAMQCLEGLLIVNCPRVKKVPEGLERLRRLKRIVVGQTSDELKNRLNEGGEDCVKIKARSPNVDIKFIY